jgi:6-pyruvoyltetrahydropterin/6-carboxytetrahydropterin synthase
MYEISVESSFSAAHRLKNYQGPCENLHGHNWLVRATVRSEGLNASGLGIDFKVLKERLREILAELDHRDLNAVRRQKTSPGTSSKNFKARSPAVRCRWRGSTCRRHRGPALRISHNP